MNLRRWFVILSGMLCGCAPVLQSTMSPTAEAQIPVERVLIKGFEYKQHYVVGRDNSITPSVGVGYSFGKIANAVWHSISAGLGLSTTTTEREGYGDIGTLRTAMKNYIEDADIAELATQVAAKQVALQACYEVASRIQNNTILNFLD